MDTPPPTSIARLRSGTAARLAGLPVTTLRVWERRYGVVAAPKTATGQRLYSQHDVQRLRLLRQLTDRGHAIGTMALLPLDALQLLAAAQPPEPMPVRRTVVIGHVASQRLQAAPGCEVLATFDDADAADDAPTLPPGPVDVLVVQLASLQPGDAPRLLALRTRLGAAALVVSYAFGTAAGVQALRAAGATVVRDPVSARELLRLVCGAAGPSDRDIRPGTAPAPRRYGDAALAALAEHPSTVACECPRHLAEILLQLASFERYSSDCGARTPADAALHQALAALAGHTRAQFEQALDRVIAAEGISLPL